MPHWLQKLERRAFLLPHFGQRSVSLRLGIATKGPLAPLMILRSRITNDPSNVMEQNARRRSWASPISFTRTSVICTASLPDKMSTAVPAIGDRRCEFVGVKQGRKKSVLPVRRDSSLAPERAHTSIHGEEVVRDAFPPGISALRA